MKNIIIIDDTLDALKLVSALFEEYVEGEKNIVPLLYFHNIKGEKQLDSIEVSREIPVNGIKELLSEDFISSISEKINHDLNCWALIDIRLDVKTYYKFNNFREWESVRFAERLVNTGIVKKSRLFFYGLVVDLPPILTQFRKETSNMKWNEPLPRPLATSGMNNERQKRKFVEIAMNPLEERDTEGESEC